MFQEADRLTPPPGLWRQIEAQVEMTSARRARGADFWRAPAFRAAASVVLAVGLLGLGVFLQKRPHPMAAATATQAAAEQDVEIIDPELLGWHADLGELTDEVEEVVEAEEVL
jgi:hypothetical protein